MVRCGKNSNELMLIIITNEEEIKNIDKIISLLTTEFNNLKSIIQNINKKDTNIIMGDKCITLFGNEKIVDNIGNYKYNISPLSFYQVNPVQIEVLYTLAKEFANLKKEDYVFDLYCGIGTIGIFVAKQCKKVIGVEIVEDAIKDAKINASLNNIENIEFYCGASEEIVPKLYESGIKADVVFVDPPRKGCDEELLKTISKMNARSIVYISCNVATLARDLKFFVNNKYTIEKVQGVDMFPWTNHVETIASLSRKN